MITCMLGRYVVSQSYLYPNLSEGADNCAEIKSAGVTNSGRVWRKVPESDAVRSVARRLAVPVRES